MSEPSALFQAIQAGDAATVTDLVEARAEWLSAESPSGLSPLLFAAYYHRPQMAALLIELGAPVSVFEAAAVGSEMHLQTALATDGSLLHAHRPDGFSLLGLTSFFGHEAAARLLLALGADVNAASRNVMRATPLRSAAAGDHTPLARLLLEAGADPDAAQHGGYTPLQSAAQNGNSDLVQLLLAAGADPRARNDQGQDALALAQENGHAEVARLLDDPNINSA
ncbi:ankyrin repeat domain-containing protein [Deinococcus sp.]|uniref:ankyrin repeat domain-containing protein n=1 Tax=Deinococcus sp. TaxID=47478 RepID=UPI003C7E66AF